MLDWQSEASRKLENTNFSSFEREEVARELASYLEDLFNEARRCGLDEAAAIQNALNELYQDARLGTKLGRARKENIMNDRTKGLWLPGSVILVVTVVCLVICEIFGVQPYIAAHFGSAANYSRVEIYPWLLVLPFLGAASAYFSRRAGSGCALRVTAGIFPVLVFFVGIVIVVPLSFGINGVKATAETFPSLAAGVLSIVVIPGLALLLGVLPFLRDSNANRRIA
ncbi:MAG TPA: hypothetical protein VKB26_11250 [Candidatus Acidoferrales bacterium]|nr:hypothetical protein [Candidatus Acidoferrales bacterium]